ncbi:hypothetical protein BT96DRAFT_89138 [Gymnopus androsaceus JB14]|uniref:Uncharacterized protein n=1 Tax=Gymnopus androsaceus JB14 TaxID=1447944 RepID=A0A6A4HIZ6_9AGAR|nr:hypothetical protein BT96DRAFT_89138 [Gymnopus androsaceus JB14]
MNFERQYIMILTSATCYCLIIFCLFSLLEWEIDPFRFVSFSVLGGIRRPRREGTTTEKIRSDIRSFKTKDKVENTETTDTSGASCRTDSRARRASLYI